MGCTAFMNKLLVFACPIIVLLLSGCTTNEEGSNSERTTQGVGIGFGDNYVREGDPLSEHQQYIDGGF